MTSQTLTTANPFAVAAAAARQRSEHDLARRISAEGRIVHKLVSHAIESGYCVSVRDGSFIDGEGEWVLKSSTDLAAILAAMFSTDGDTLTIRNPNDKSTNNIGAKVGSVSLVYGNGNEVISDYSSADLDAFSAWIKPVEDFAEEA